MKLRNHERLGANVSLARWDSWKRRSVAWVFVRIHLIHILRYTDYIYRIKRNRDVLISRTNAFHVVCAPTPVHSASFVVSIVQYAPTRNDGYATSVIECTPSNFVRATRRIDSLSARASGIVRVFTKPCEWQQQSAGIVARWRWGRQRAR